MFWRCVLFDPHPKSRHLRDCFLEIDPDLPQLVIYPEIFRVRLRHSIQTTDFSRRTVLGQLDVNSYGI